jgi:hypothetical protein
MKNYRKEVIMKRLFLIVILALIVPAALFAQIDWLKYTIADGSSGGHIYAIDFDGDDDVDVIGTLNKGIGWWENDGNENFTEHNVAVPTTLGYHDIYAIDLDDDDDVDVLGAALYDDEIAWWENEGGTPPNFIKHTIDTLFDGAISVYAIDLDDDDDVDVLGAALYDDEIAWWENEGGTPPNFIKHTIDFFDGAYSVYSINMDDDDDVDVLGAAYASNWIAWWQNDGEGNFGSIQVIDFNFSGAMDVFAIDIEPDNDVDVVGAAFTGNDITWWKNNGSEYFTEHTIDPGFDKANAVFAIDIDKDTDRDILGASRGATQDGIYCWENDGEENFIPDTIDAHFNHATDVFAIDLDGDTDIDILGITSNGEIAWWQSSLVSMNVGVASIDIPLELPVDITLNPQATVVNVGSDYESFDVTCEIDVGYTSTESINDLAPDESLQVTFSNEFTFAAGFHTVTVYTQLAEDENCANDTLQITVHASLIDASPISIDILDTIPEYTTLNPMATIKNQGSETASFPVTCEIQPGDYTKTQTVHDLAPGDNIQVTFFTEFTFETGAYFVTVFTRLEGDENPTNDTLKKIIQTHDPGITEGHRDIPKKFMFNAPTITESRTKIMLALPEATKVDLAVYDALGRLSEILVSKRLSAGIHTISAKFDLPTGIYFYKLKTTSGENVTTKFLLVE